MPKVRVPRGVGRTAILVCWARMEETHKQDELFRDPFAEVVLSELATRPETSKLIPDIDALLTSMSSSWQIGDLATYVAVRTRYFDDHLLAATGGGIRQVVALAAGLDGRTVRLDWPAETKVYELDLPDMITFKDTMLTQSQLPLRCQRYGIAADLNADWETKLLDAEFNPDAPTAWLVEGLLPYLTPESCDTLIAKLTQLSAPGSELLTEQLHKVTEGETGRPMREVVESVGTTLCSARDDLPSWLAEYGWHAEMNASYDPAISHGRTVPESLALWLVHGVLR